MDWKTDYDRKRVSAAEAMACVNSGDRVVFAHACGEPLDLVDALVARAPELRNVEIVHMVAMGKGEYSKPEYAESFFHNSLFTGGSTREAVNERPRRLRAGVLPRDPQALLRGVPAAGRGPHPRLSARRARLLLVRHLGRLHQARRPGRQDGGRAGQPQDAAHARRLVHPRLRHRLHRRERARHHRAAAAQDRPDRRGDRQAHRRAGATTGPACSSASAASPTRCCSSCTTRTTWASTPRCSARASSTSTTRAW